MFIRSFNGIIVNLLDAAIVDREDMGGDYTAIVAEMQNGRRIELGLYDDGIANDVFDEFEGWIERGGTGLFSFWRDVTEADQERSPLSGCLWRHR